MNLFYQLFVVTLVSTYVKVAHSHVECSEEVDSSHSGQVGHVGRGSSGGRPAAMTTINVFNHAGTHHRVHAAEAETEDPCISEVPFVPEPEPLPLPPALPDPGDDECDSEEIEGGLAADYSSSDDEYRMKKRRNDKIKEKKQHGGNKRKSSSTHHLAPHKVMKARYEPKRVNKRKAIINDDYVFKI